MRILSKVRYAVTLILVFYVGFPQLVHGQASGKALDIGEVSGVHADGVTDDSDAVQSALNQASNTPSKTLALGGRVYYLNNNIALPSGTRLTCVGHAMGQIAINGNYKARPCTLLFGAGYSLQTNSGSQVDHVTILPATYNRPTTMRQGVAAVAAFAGTGLTINGEDVSVHDTMVLGFDLCIDDQLHSRTRLDRIQGDCTNGIRQSQSHDVSRYHDIHLWPFLTAGTNWYLNAANMPVLGLANNGSGGVRVSYKPGPEPLMTGDTVLLAGIQGVPYAMRGNHVITVVDEMHFDLQGVTWPSGGVFALRIARGAAAGTATSANLGATLGPGMVVVGPFAKGTMVSGWNGPTVQFGAVANAAVTGASVPVAPATVPGGTATLDLTHRAGVGFSWAASENSTCDHCFEFGHEVGYLLNSGASGIECDNCSFDGAPESATSIGIKVMPGAQGPTFIGGYGDGKGTLIYQGDTANSVYGTKLVGMTLSPGSVYQPTINVMAGYFTMTGSSLAPLGTTADIAGRGSIVIGDAVAGAIFSGNMLGPTRFSAGKAGAAVLVQSANISGGGP